MRTILTALRDAHVAGTVDFEACTVRFEPTRALDEETARRIRARPQALAVWLALSDATDPSRLGAALEVLPDADFEHEAALGQRLNAAWLSGERGAFFEALREWTEFLAHLPLVAGQSPVWLWWMRYAPDPSPEATVVPDGYPGPLASFLTTETHSCIPRT